MIRSETKQKILLLLVAGVALGFSRSPKNYFKILDDIAKEWKEIDRKNLVRVVKEFYYDRLIKYREKEDGTIEIILTKDGRKKALQYKVDEMKIKEPVKWDGKWRMVIFDIPERKKIGREVLRDKLRNLGFKELQKSVFIHPYECEDEIDFIVEVYDLRSYVRFIRAESFTNEEQFKLKFKLH